MKLNHFTEINVNSVWQYHFRGKKIKNIFTNA